MDTIGDRIAALRRARGLSQAQLGRKIGCTPSFISHVERGKSSISVTDVKAWARALGISVGGLFGETTPGHVKLPHRGKACAGAVKFWQESGDSEPQRPPVQIPEEWVNPAFTHFALTAEGNSMAGVGILDGDLLIVEVGALPQRGDVVIARTVFGDVLVKKYAHLEGHTVLSPGSLLEHDLTFLHDSDVEILGRVRHVLRLGPSALEETHGIEPRPGPCSRPLRRLRGRFATLPGPRRRRGPLR